MTLRSKLFLSTSLEIILVISASIFLIMSSRHINRTIDKEIKASQIVETVSQIRFVTFENLLHHDERSFEQWQAKHDDLSSLLEPGEYHSLAERQILEKILNDSREVSVLFNRLVESYSVSSPGQNVSIQEAFQQRLSTQLLSRQQAQISDAFKLANTARAETAVLRMQANRLVTIIIVLMFLIMAINFFFIAGTITKALIVFQKGAEKIAAGKLDYRIKVKNRTDELGRLAAAFNSMAASLEQIDEVKSDLLLLASHQLRTPLTSIKWSSEALTAPTSTTDSDKQQRYIKQIHDSTERMITLVNEFLSAAKIELGTSSSNPQSVELTPLVERILNDLASMADSNGITIVKKIDTQLPAIWIDASWIHIIFENLFSNAIKYSPVGSTVTITIQRSKANVLIEVTDSGCGIPANQRDKIFTKLFRADNAKRIIGEGSGLGLYITKALVEQSGGTIWFESVEDKGSTFYVKLPVENRKSN